MNKNGKVESSNFSNSKSPISSTSSASRKTLIERLAALRIQSEPQALNKKVSAKPESPRYIPRNNQIIANQSSTSSSIKSKVYNYSKSSTDTDITYYSDSRSSGSVFKDNNFDNDDYNQPSSPTIGRRRKLASAAGLTNNNIKTNKEIIRNNINITNTSVNHQAPSPIGISSPKYFHKQKALEFDTNLINTIQTVPQTQIPDIQSKSERNHSAKDIVSGFINSFTILNNFLTKSNAPVAKIQLQNMNEAFAALQMDLKTAVESMSLLQAENEQKNAEIKIFKEKMTEISDHDHTIEELEEQLKISLSHVSEITISLNKEKSNVEFLQNYMEEVLQLKDDGEKQTNQLRKRISELEHENQILIKSVNSNEQDKIEDQDEILKFQSLNLKEENEQLKETIKLLELERFSTKNVCEQAIQGLDLQNSSKTLQTTSSNNFEVLQTELNQIRQELKQKQVEIDKLQGREKHFKESNEIFQQKLLILTEENRKLKGQRPINHY